MLNNLLQNRVLLLRFNESVVIFKSSFLSEMIYSII